MSAGHERIRLEISGAVQGVGFRPFVYRLALEYGVSGWVLNSPQGVVIEAEAPPPVLDAFADAIAQQKPPRARITRFESLRLPAVGYKGFEIRHSDSSGAKTTVILPDIATCPDCTRELFDPDDRRYRYPFINCTNCGPRYSIVLGLPYDRPNTTMRGFALCDACRAEYENPLDRRFHAQPVACPVCGPQLAAWTRDGVPYAAREDALQAAIDALHRGQIVALKGLGGFHLMVDARDSQAVMRLRERKRRPDKPFAVMFTDAAHVMASCLCDDAEQALLESAEAPIVLLKQRPHGEITQSVAPNNPYVGAMLPYTPLHLLLMRGLGFPIVATSGNLSGEPVCIDEHDALARLGGIADMFLVHDRPIARQVDDSVVRIAAGRPLFLRRARGYAPMPLPLPADSKPMLAVGAHQKNVIAAAQQRQLVLSQHIGDMDTPEASAAFERITADLRQLYEIDYQAAACDLHPDYRSTRHAEALGLPLVRVQHHYAHALSCMIDNTDAGLKPPFLAVVWDGTGYGTDGTIWGGEFLWIGANGYQRFAHLEPFRLPGGEQAIREPRRCALGLLHALYGDALPDCPPLNTFRAGELDLLRRSLERGLNAPVTSSAGRLFDALAALADVRQFTTFEGQAAMEFEFLAEGTNPDACYPISVTHDTVKKDTNQHIVRVSSLVSGVLDDVHAGISAAMIAAKAHHTLADAIVQVAQRAALENVALSGGCFQNRVLLEAAIQRLQAAGFRPFWHVSIPPNDGGIAAGQIAAAMRA